MSEFEGRSEIEILKRVSDPEQRHRAWVDVDDLHFERPTVLCLSGNRATTNQQVDGFAKTAETNLDLLFKVKDENGNWIRPYDKADILSVKYSRNGGFNYHAVQLLASALFELLVDDKGQRLSLDKAQQKMSRVIFFTYCAGNARLREVITCLNQKLATVGYRQDEIRAINGASLEVSYAPHAEFYNMIPSVRVISKQDDMIGPATFEMLEDGGVVNSHFDGICLHQDMAGSGKLYGVSSDDYLDLSTKSVSSYETVTAGSIQIISSKLVNTCSRAINEHNVGILRRDKNWQLHPVMNRDGVTFRSPNADCVSQMTAWALCKGMENAMQNFTASHYVPNTYWHELMDDFQSILGDYRQTQLSEDLGLER